MEPSPQTGVSYFGNRNPHHFAADLADIKAHNCNFIVHTYSENDQQFFKDTLAELAGMTREAGLSVWLDPWGVGRVFGGETYSAFALRHLSACQILPDGTAAPAVCFNQPVFRQFMQQWIEDAAEIGADVLFWDEPHFYIDIWNKESYDVWYCRCPACDQCFQEANGRHIYEADRAAILGFREDCVVEFLDELCRAARARGMKNAVCMLPFKDEAIGLSDWSRVAGIPALDIFGTDPYWMFFDKDIDSFVGGFSRDVVELCRRHGKEAQIWLQAYKIASGRENELQRAAAVAYAAGVRNFAAWSYLGNAYMSYNRSDNPQRVWQVTGEIFDRILRGESPA